MTHDGFRNRALITLALLFALAATGWAGDNAFQGNLGGSFFSVSPPCPVKQFPTFETLVPVPGLVDPFEQDFIPMFCQLQVDREGDGVRKVKGRFDADLVVLDNETGEAEVFDIDSGTFRTDKSGRASFNFDLPSELFADGFESGDVSAWSYTRTDLTNKKKGSAASISCQTSSSRSQQTTWVIDDK